MPGHPEHRGLSIRFRALGNQTRLCAGVRELPLEEPDTLYPLKEDQKSEDLPDRFSLRESRYAYCFALIGGREDRRVGTTPGEKSLAIRHFHLLDSEIVSSGYAE